MPKFNVHLRQFVEQVATIVVEAVDADAARFKVGDDVRAGNTAPDWAPGDDAMSVTVYAVADADGYVVWER